jgi:hypothetical protein
MPSLPRGHLLIYSNSPQVFRNNLSGRWLFSRQVSTIPDGKPADSIRCIERVGFTVSKNYLRENKRPPSDEAAKKIDSSFSLRSYKWGRNLRRAAPTIPKIPVLSNASVEGSGVCPMEGYKVNEPVSRRSCVLLAKRMALVREQRLWRLQEWRGWRVGKKGA